jgi:hypothetical protein
VKTIAYKQIDNGDIYREAIRLLRSGVKPEKFCSACKEWCLPCTISEARMAVEKKYPPMHVFENDGIFMYCIAIVQNAKGQDTQEGAIKVLESALKRWKKSL